jgi:hypothetical protein
MADKEKLRFKVIKTYPTGDCMCMCEYEGTIRELCVELNKYTGGVYIWSRRILEKKLYLYEKEHEEIHFEVKSLNARRWRVIDKNQLKYS